MSIKFDSKEVKAFFQETCKLGGSKKEIDTAIERNKLSEYLANNKDNMSVGDIATFNTYLKPPAQNAPTQPKDVEVNVYGSMKDIVKTNGLEGKHFQNREPEFNYIMDHFKQYGNVPDPIVLLSHFPDFDLMQVNESDDFLVNKIFEEYGFTKFTEMLPQLNEKLKEDRRYKWIIN